MIGGEGGDYVKTQLVLGTSAMTDIGLSGLDIKGVTLFFFSLYFLMAMQDIAVIG